jgi:hypothetical protein
MRAFTGASGGVKRSTQWMLVGLVLLDRTSISAISPHIYSFSQGRLV